MDPFLEDPIVFPDFHDSFIYCLREFLQPGLPEPYYAALGRRAWVEVSERFIGPDVNVIASAHTPTGSRAALATMKVSQPVVIHVPHDEQSESLVEVYIGRGGERRLVTAIELLSPANKKPGEKGRDLYLRKQAELLDSKTHLVEIDLLRGGEHTTAVPEKRLRRFVPHFKYHVCSHRYDHFEDFLIHPIQLAEPLPTIHIPLLPGDGEVPVNLQQVLTRTYDAGPYHREIDYRANVPEPNLTEQELEWVGKKLEVRS
jgi:hypothetical protein